jgi:hypothetical protein
MEISDPPTLSAQLLALKTLHRELDVEISSLLENPYFDQLYMQRQKRQKLRIKENIGRIESLLIPDLNA